MALVMLCVAYGQILLFTFHGFIYICDSKTLCCLYKNLLCCTEKLTKMKMKVHDSPLRRTNNDELAYKPPGGGETSSKYGYTRGDGVC